MTSRGRYPHPPGGCALRTGILLSLLLLTTGGIAQPTLPDGDALARGIEAYRLADYAAALDLLEPLAEAGQVRAQVTVGLMYEQGHGVEKDVQAAVRLFERAAQNGNATLRHDLGVKYFKGEGIPQDYAAAARWWRLSAQEGLAQSQYDLGVLHYRGLGVEKSYAEAARLYAAAAEQGHARAQYSLAVMYALGRGISRDYTMAADWFRRAAQQGDALSQYNYALLLENGWGVDVDTEEALMWFRRAADQDLAQAQTRLAEMASPRPAPAAAVRDAAPASRTPSSDGSLAWVHRFDPEAFTLQLASLLDAPAARQMLLRLDEVGVQAGIAIYEAGGQTRHAVLYGVYEDRAAAEAAAARLPAPFAGTRPWVRSMRALQAISAR